MTARFIVGLRRSFLWPIALLGALTLAGCGPGHEPPPAFRPTTFAAVSEALGALPDVRVTSASGTPALPLTFTLDTPRTREELRGVLRDARLNPDDVVLNVLPAPTLPRTTTATIAVEASLAIPGKVRAGAGFPLAVTLTNRTGANYAGMLGVCSVRYTILDASSRRPVDWRPGSLTCVSLGVPVNLPNDASCLLPERYFGAEAVTLGRRPLPPGEYVLQATLSNLEPGSTVVAFPDRPFRVVATDAEAEPFPLPDLPRCNQSGPS